ncbi:MAG: hypothetical protein LBR98_06925 [Syntrophomonadaceae bacterium]|nr:hypothetical protein [Syntrophomonadaceae bacterium]
MRIALLRDTGLRGQPCTPQGGQWRRDVSCTDLTVTRCWVEILSNSEKNKP